MTGSGRVVVVGSINLDLTMRVARLPTPGETTLATEVAESLGGKGANQAVAAAAAGAATRLIGSVGADENGARVRDEIAARGVDVRAVTRRPGVETGRAVVTVDAAGENSIVVAAGANAVGDDAPVDQALADLHPADVVVLQNEIHPAIGLRAARSARARGARVVWNAAPAPAGDATLVDPIDLLVVNEGELSAVAARLGFPTTGSGGTATLVTGLAERLGAGVVCTRGAAGAVFALDGDSGAVGSPQVRAVDTTGAGDTFVGYLCAQWADDPTIAAHDAIGLASTAAALAVTRPGAAAAIPHRGEVERLRARPVTHPQRGR